jgi:phosphatidylcholine synthase
MDKVLAWCVHLYTALGSILAFAMVVAAFEKDVSLFLWLILATLVIDGTDGILARHLQVKKVIPHYDGTTLDNIVDYLTYAFAPAIFFWTIIPHNTVGVIAIAMLLLSSCYQFCRIDAKSDNHNYYFLGFPDYWNIIALYAILLPLSPLVTIILIITCSILVFVPIKFIYPTRTQQYKKLNLSAASIYFVLFIIILIQYPNTNISLVILSLLYWLYYLIMSLYLTIQIKK